MSGEFRIFAVNLRSFHEIRIVMKKSIITAIMAAGCAAATAQIPLDYYAGLDGLTGRELKQAVHEIISRDVNMLTYGSGNYKTWWAFYVTDRTADGNVRDRYSSGTFRFGERGASVSGMNIEHSFPKSWWGGEENNAYKDLYNLMPCETTINNHKSNYPMATVDVEWRGNGVTKVGTRSGDPTTQDYRYWEPSDQWKGDFARGYFYMATAYQDFTWSGSQSPRILSTGDFPTLLGWASALYLDWSEADGVDDVETARNNAVERIQGNRNPFVDFPNLAQYIWGDSVGKAFNPLTSIKSQPFIGGATIKEKEAENTELYFCSFLGDRGTCTVETASGSASGINVWSNTADYGWKGSGARGPSDAIVRYATDATLLTPEIDLSDNRAAWFSFDHAVNFAEAPYDCLTVEVRADGESSTLHVRRWPLGNKWNFCNSSVVDLTPWAGKRVKIGFHYTSTTDEAATWEIKNLRILGVAGEAGVESVGIDFDNSCVSGVEEYFSVDGRRLSAPGDAHGIVIIRRGSEVRKIFIP